MPGIVVLSTFGGFLFAPCASSRQPREEGVGYPTRAVDTIDVGGASPTGDPFKMSRDYSRRFFCMTAFWSALWFTGGLITAQPVAGSGRQSSNNPGSSVKCYPAFGVVLSIDRAHNTFAASIQEIPGFMDAMAMPFNVRDPLEIKALHAGEMIDFTLAVGKDASWAENIRPHVFENGDAEEQEALRLRLLQRLNAPTSSVKPLAAGDVVPDFDLIDQTGASVRLSQFRGKVVALTFMYTRCPLPDYCFRLNNNFGNLQRRFASELGKNLVLLSISFDPVHDQPAVLAEYAKTWKANPQDWHFLTGPLPEVEKVCHEFDLNFWVEMGMITHTLHTVVIDRQGRVVANLEGNQFSARQLGDLIQATLERTETQSVRSQ